MTLKEMHGEKVYAWKSVAVDEDHLLYINTSSSESGKILDLEEVKELRDVLEDFIVYQSTRHEKAVEEIYGLSRFGIREALLNGTITYNPVSEPTNGNREQ